MPKYLCKQKFTNRWSSEVMIDLVPGREYDLPEDQAKWVNNDRPGTLELAKEKPKVRAKKAPGSNRQVKAPKGDR